MPKGPYRRMLALGCALLLTAGLAGARSTLSGVGVNRQFSDQTPKAGDVVTVTLTVTFPDLGSDPVKGFYVSDHVPDGLSPASGTAKLNGSAISVTRESEAKGTVYSNCTTERWVLATPPDFTEGNSINGGSTLVVTYTVTIPGGAQVGDTYTFPGHTWVAMRPTMTAPENGDHFGYEDSAQTLTVDAPPAAPTNLQATAVSSSQIDLIWQDNSSNETGFKIGRKTGAGGVWSPLDQTGAGENTYRDTGLDPGTTYYYRVCAWNGAGDSAWCAEKSAMTPALTITVTYPAGGESFRGKQSVKIRWTSNMPGNVKIQFSEDNGSHWAPAVDSTENDGVCAWELPNTDSAICLLRVSDLDGTPQDDSGVFTITSIADADNDRMDDDWEAEHGLDPEVNDANRDPDGDGRSNLEEFWLGSDPTGTTGGRTGGGLSCAPGGRGAGDGALALLGLLVLALPGILGRGRGATARERR